MDSFFLFFFEVLNFIPGRNNHSYLNKAWMRIWETNQLGSNLVQKSTDPAHLRFSNGHARLFNIKPTSLFSIYYYIFNDFAITPVVSEEYLLFKCLSELSFCSHSSPLHCVARGHDINKTLLVLQMINCEAIACWRSEWTSLHDLVSDLEHDQDFQLP